MKTSLFNNLSRNTHKIGFALKKHSPEILVVAGVIGTVASTVMACKATTKLDTILNESKNKVDKVNAVIENPELVKEDEEYTEGDAKKDLTIIYTQTCVNLVKLYAPAIVLGTLSLGCVLTSHKIMKKRNIAIAAAYATVDKGFKEYRNRVVERFGEKTDRELKYDIKSKVVENVLIDEKGKEKTVTETIDVAESSLSTYSDYAKFFDNGNPFWEKDSEYNLMFLKQQERVANDKLKAMGMLFLNDVYEMLGIPKTKAGQVVGWVYDEKCPFGDNYIDFGIYDTHRPNTANNDFVNGYEKSIILDFNVDGNIWDLM